MLSDTPSETAAKVPGNNKEESLANRGADLFDETVVSLYDAATDIDKWPVFLERLGALFKAPVSQVIYYDFELEELTFQVHRGLDGFPPEMHQRYEELSPKSEQVAEIMRLPEKPVTNAMLMDRESFEAMPVYREVHGPSGIGGYGRALSVHLEPSTFVALARRSMDPTFDDEDCALLGRLVPHLKRALALHRRLSLLETERVDALSALDAMPLGVLLTDGDGRICQANRTAREIAARGDGLLISGGFIAAWRQENTALLLDTVRKATRGALDGAPPPAEALTLARRNGVSGYPVVISALWGNPQKLGLGHLDRPLAALFVTDPDRPQEAPAELLQRLFGLTAAEAAVAERLTAGQSLRAVAEALGVSHHTARTHLKRIFNKTDTRRQAELVKKIMDTPVWAAARESQRVWRQRLHDKNA